MAANEYEHKMGDFLLFYVLKYSK